VTGALPGGTPPPAGTPAGPPAGPPPAGTPAGPPFALPADTATTFLTGLAAASQQLHLLQRGAPPAATLHRYDLTVQSVVDGFGPAHAPGPDNAPADDDTPT
jgi:hypothetical protein